MSECCLNPTPCGPAPHKHKAQVFYVLAGTIYMLVADDWIDAPKGTFISIPRFTIHNFANRTQAVQEC
ncbi:cupin domain-containing protein [Segetibacter sp. 3557_3]|uniref:cupin domain-containing protein n=1 Tax=Segetibacter sp. 3557_3 TaxID=2547429 RepID=UPI001058A2B0|nr:cupin domain-containing protein [Segetibacter sp. 3557_3]